MWDLLAAIDRDHPQFATVYLPALDVVLNRLNLDPSARLAASLRAIDGVVAAVAELRKRGYEIVLAGLPGDRQDGRGVLAASFGLGARSASPFDIAPTLCAVEGFPFPLKCPANRLPVWKARASRPTARALRPPSAQADQEYYRNLKFSGYPVKTRMGPMGPMGRMGQMGHRSHSSHRSYTSHASHASHSSHFEGEP